MYGESQTAWSTRVCYKTNGVHYPEFAIGDKKTLGDLYWVVNGTVDYNQATYIGKQGDMVAYVIDDTITAELCSPAKPIDSGVGIDPSNPPDVPTIEFVNPPKEICIDNESITISATASDNVGLKSVTYSISVNGVTVYGPYTDDTNKQQYDISYVLTTSQLQVGDTVQLYAQAVNVFNVSATKTIDLIVENCDSGPPQIQVAPLPIDATKGKICYSSLNTDNTLTIQMNITDDTSVDRWSVTDGTWTQDSETYPENTLDTGTVSVNVPVTVPEKVTYTETQTGKPVDIVFILDVSGSMSRAINSMANQIQSFCDSLNARNINWQAAVTIYSDINIGEPILQHPFRSKTEVSTLIQDFTSLTDGSGTDGWRMMGGGDAAESGLEGIMQGAMSYTFREGSVREFILLTDAKVHTQSDGYSSYTIPQVIQALQENHVRLSIVSKINGTEQKQLKPMADATGGRYYDIYSGNYGLAMSELADDIIVSAEFIPDSEKTITITAWDKSGKTATQTLQLQFTDCSYNPAS